MRLGWCLVVDIWHYSERMPGKSTSLPNPPFPLPVLIVLFEPVPGAKAAQRLGDGLAQ